MKRAIFIFVLTALPCFAESILITQAKTLYAANRFREAGILYERYANEDAPSNANVWFNAGVCYKNAGDIDSAIRAFANVTAVLPEDSETYGVLGGLYRQQGNVSMMISAYSNAARFAKNNTAKRDFYKDLGNSYYDNEEYDRAEQAFLAATEIDPCFSMAYNNLGTIELVRENYDRATLMFERALRTDPSNTFPLLNLTLVYARLRNKQAAEDYASRSIAKQTPYPQYAFLYLSLLHGNLGDIDAALSNIERAFEYDRTKPALDFDEDIAKEAGFQTLLQNERFARAVNAYFSQ